MLHSPMLPQITREIPAEEVRFAALQLDPTGRILSYEGIDLPDISLSSRDSVGENILDIWDGFQPLHDLAVRLLAGESVSLTVRAALEDTQPHMHRVFGSPVKIGDSMGVLMHAFQIPNHYVRSRDYQETLRTAAETDSLTGAVNRRRFNQELSLELELTRTNGRHGAVIYMDLDDFKAVNDSLGHGAGDGVLVRITRCLQENLREHDILARLGGDEFAILVPGVSGAEAMDIARRLMRSVRDHHIFVEERELRVTMSVGVSLYPTHGVTSDQVLAHADSAMYKVKAAGRNDVALFDPKEDTRAYSDTRLRWKRGIAEALSNDRFLFYAQPMVDLGTGTTWRHEILLRMRDSRNRIVLPAAFLGVAENSGFMHEIDHWVTRAAMHLCYELRDASDAGISFNLSATVLNDDDLLRTIEKTLQFGNIDPSRVCIEITEAAAVSNVRQAHRFLRRLKALGVRVALDDFGAGFSSFSQLKNLPVDYLKIDGSFVKNLARSKADQALTKAIGEVARGLGMQVIAEFVGDAETVNLLREYGIEYGQGYYLGKPAPVTAAFPELRQGTNSERLSEARPRRLSVA